MGRKPKSRAARSFQRGFWAVVALLGVGLAGAVGYGIFAPLHIHYTWTDKDRLACAVPQVPQAPMLGLALSGGGSRAAIFAAAGMRELEAAGILERITHVSSVSGGGFAASYWATHPDLRGEGFDAMLRTLQTDFFWEMEAQQARHPNRVFSPSRRLISLQEALDSAFLGGKAFGDVGAGRSFHFNTVSYDTAQRFVFSNDVMRHGDDVDLVLAPALRTASFAQPGCPHASASTIPLSLAVATSAAFPPLLGPASIHVPGLGEYWHLGDGGIVENTGVETLQEIALRNQAANPALGGAVIISFNAGLRVDTAASLRDPDLSIFSTNPDRVIDLANMRAEAYREAYLRALGVQFRVISLDYYTVDVTDWPAGCTPSEREGRTPLDAIRSVPTGLSITACDAALIEAAAVAVVKASFLDPGGLGQIALE